jgi:predicted AlkP superfamily phosphohydrolase/phosphomutase
LDGFLKETVELAGPESTVTIVSDHGFTGTRNVFYVNTWLQQRGYLAWNPETELTGESSEQLDEGTLFDHFRLFDLKGTKALAPSAGSNGIHILVRGRRSEYGIAPEAYDSFRRRLKQELLAECRHPETGEPLVKEVWLREANFAGPYMEDAPDITLTLSDYGLVSVLRGRSIAKKRPAVAGTHHPDGVFLARGRGIRTDSTVRPLRLIDVAPTLLYTLLPEIPAELEGEVVEDVFTPEFRRSHQVLRRSAGELIAPVMPRDGRGLLDQDEQIFERMKALGYIE